MKQAQLKKKTTLILIYKLATLVLILALMLAPRSISKDAEIESKLLIAALGIDSTTDGFEVSALAVLPEDAQSGGIVKLLVRGEGRSVRTAIDDISSKMGKGLELFLCGTIIFGDNFEDAGVLEISQYLLSSGMVSPGIFLLSANKMSAKNILDKSISLNDATITRMAKLVEFNQAYLNISAITLLKFVEDSANMAATSIMPAIEITTKKPANEEGSNESGMGALNDSGGGGGSDTTKTEGGGAQNGGDATEIISMENVFVFKNGFKKKILTKEQSRGVAWADKKSKHGYYVIQDFVYEGRDIGILNFKVSHKKCRIRASLVDGQPRATIKLDLRMSFEDKFKMLFIEEQDNGSFAKLLKEVEAAVSKNIRQEILSAVEESKLLDCDVFQLMPHIRRYHNKAFKRYENKTEMYQNTSVDIDVKLRLY